MTVKRFLLECNQREVFKKLSLFIVFSWILIQVLAVTWEPLGLPKKSVTILIISLLILFPIYAFYIGRFEVKELRDESLADGVETEKERSDIKIFKRFFYVSVLGITGIVATVVFYLIATNFYRSSRRIVIDVSDKIAVLQFDNLTGNAKYEVVSEMTADWIIQGIIENGIGKVISPQIVKTYKSYFKKPDAVETSGKEVLQKIIKPTTIIQGNFYLRKQELIFKASVVDGVTDAVVMSFDPIRCSESDPLVCIENLKQVLLGYFVTESTQDLNLQRKPPQFKAYQNVLNAKEKYDYADPNYLTLINEAIRIDSTYFEPKVLRISYYYNRGAFKMADSLLSIIPLTTTNTRQLNLLKMYASLLKGEHGQTYRYLKKEYQLAPFELATNSSAMVVAQQFVNKPEDVQTIFSEVSMAGMDLESCAPCHTRLLMKATSDLSLKKYDTILMNDLNKVYAERPYLLAILSTQNTNQIETYLTQKKYKNPGESLASTYFFIGHHLLVQGNQESSKYFKKVLETATSDKTIGLAAFYLSNYGFSRKHLERYLEEYPEDLEVLSKLAMIYYQEGNKEAAGRYRTFLDTVDGTYLFGDDYYAQAQYEAFVGNKERALALLARAAAAGKFYTLFTYTNDPHFKPYLETQQMDNIMSFWH